MRLQYERSAPTSCSLLRWNQRSRRSQLARWWDARQFDLAQLVHSAQRFHSCILSENRILTEHAVRDGLKAPRHMCTMNTLRESIDIDLHATRTDGVRDYVE